MTTRRLFSVLILFSLFVAAGVFTVGCSSEEGTSEAETGQLKSGSSQDKGEPELEEKPGSAEKPGKKESPKVKVPEGKHAFRWDFSKKYKFVYNFEQTAKTTSSGRTQEQRGTGTLQVKARGDNTANLAITDMVVKPDPGMEVPPVVLQGMTEDSKIPGVTASTPGSIDMLFPLPAESLKVGESATIPSRMPVNASGVPVWARGTTKVTLKDYVTIESHVCAKFYIVVNISDLDVPKDSPFKYEYLTKGSGVLYFDIEDRCFHSGEINMSMILSVGTEPGSPFGQKRTTMGMETLAKYTRNKEKEEEANKK